MEKLELDVVYEGGVFKPTCKPPLKEGQKVTITVHASVGATDRMQGLLKWNGDQDELHRFLDDDDEGILGNRQIG